MGRIVGSFRNGLHSQCVKYPVVAVEIDSNVVVSSPRSTHAQAVMFLPRYSIRWLLLFVGVCAVGSLVLRAGWRGEAWGGGVMVGIGFIGLTLLVNAVFFAVLWPLSIIANAVLGRARVARRSTPRPSTTSVANQEPRLDSIDV